MISQLPLREEFPDAVVVERLPLAFTIRFATTEGVCQTLEGPVAYRRGAALITGYEGEQWPVEPEVFFATYAPAENVLSGEDGRYVRLPQRLVAHQLCAPMDVTLPEQRGTLHGKAGDWLVESASGNRAIVAAEIFPKTYRIIKTAGA